MKRMENESFKDYKQRRKQDQIEIKGKLKGTLIWQSIREVGGKLKGFTFVKENKE